MDRELITGAVARGWCHSVNERKVMDTDLAFAIVDEVEKAIKDDKTPYLGCATTAELLNELKARAEIGGYANYRTVDNDGLS